MTQANAIASADVTGPGSPGTDRSRAARSVLWSGVENGGLALVSFASLIIFSRFLTPADFGLFSIVLAVVELMAVLVSMLFHDALVQRPDATRRHFDTAFSFTMGLSLLLLAACWVAAPRFAALVGDPVAGSVLVWTALSLPCLALATTIVARQRRELAFRALALRSLVGRLTGAAAGITLVVLGAGYWGLVTQHVLIALTGSLVLWWASTARPSLRFGGTEFRELIGFGAAAVGAMLLSFAVKRVFVIVAGILLGTEAAGYLNLSFRAVDVLWAIAATAVTQVALPVLSRLQAEPDRLRRAYREASEFTCLVLYLCFVGMAVLAPEAVEVLFGPKWLVCAPYVTVMALLMVVQAPRLLITPALTSVGRPRHALIGVAAELITVAGLIALWGVPSLEWALGIWVARELAAAPLMAWVLQRVTGIRLTLQLRAALVPAVAALGMAAAVYAVRLGLPADWNAWARLAGLAPVAVLAYGATAWLTDRSAVARVGGFIRSALAPSRSAAR